MEEWMIIGFEILTLFFPGNVPLKDRMRPSCVEVDTIDQVRAESGLTPVESIYQNNAHAITPVSPP